MFLGINFQQVYSTLIQFAQTTNLILFVIIFGLVFIFVRKVLKIIQWLLGFITTLWITALVVYFLINFGIFQKIIQFIENWM